MAKIDASAQPSLKSLFFQAFLISAFTFMLSLILLSALANVPFCNLLLEWSRTSYVPNFNFVAARPVLGIAPFCFIYIIFITIASAILIAFFLLRSMKKDFPVTVLKFLMIASAVSLLVIETTFQQTGRVLKFVKEFKAFSLIPPEDRYSLVAPGISAFIKSTYPKLKGQGLGIYRTDIQETGELNMIVTALLKYKYYPRIVFPIFAGAVTPEYRYILIYSKKNPLQAVPRGFHVMVQSTDLKFILAEKDE